MPADELLMSEENEKLFYHEFKPGKMVWNGSWRGIPFEVVRWEWAYETSLANPAYNSYIYLNLEYIPPKYGPTSFWLKPELFLMPIFPEKEGDELTAELNKNSKQMNRRNIKSGRTMYHYSDHPLLREIEFHGGITYYERRFEGANRIIKVGCDWNHSCDMSKLPSPISYHPLPVTLDMVINNAKEAIDSVYNLMPEYGKKERTNED